MANFAEMFAPAGTVSPDDERKRRMVELLKQSLAPEPLAEVPVPEGQTRGQEISDSIMGALGAAFQGYAGTPTNFNATEMLRRRRAERDDALAYNQRERTRYDSQSAKAGAQAEYEVLKGEMDRADKNTDRRMTEDEINKRQALNDARDVGVTASDAMTLDEINAAVAKARRDLQDAGRTTIMEKRAEDILNSAASSRVVIPPSLSARMRKGEEQAFSEARNMIASRPEAGAAGRDDKYEKDQDERLDEAMSLTETLITGDPGNVDKGIPASKSMSQLATEGADLQEIWKQYQRQLARMRLDDKRKAEAERFFWDYAYPEYMAEYAKRFNPGPMPNAVAPPSK